MKGKVEVYAIASDGSQRLVHSARNLVVDGAGELVVDMLTVPSSTLGIAPRVMDTSNWRFGALSFGPAGGAFQENGFFFPSGASWTPPGDQCDGTGSQRVSNMLNAVGVQKTLRLLSNSAREVAGDVSTYTPNYHLPSYPDPLDTRLEKEDTAYTMFSGDGTRSYGHLENRIAFASGDPSSYFQGGYPTGDATPVTVVNVPQTVIVSSFDGDFTGPTVNAMVNCASSYFPGSTQQPYFYLSSLIGGFNYASSMDYRGFATVDYSKQAAPGVGNTMVSSTAGAANVREFVQDPRVTIACYIARWDVQALNVYGGFHQMGLWGLDCKESLKSNAAPFLQDNALYIDTSGVTKQEFKLFAKKTFSSNLAATSDQSPSVPLLGTVPLPGLLNHASLLVRWTLDFRSDHD